MLTISDFINAINCYQVKYKSLPGEECARIYPQSKIIHIDRDCKEDGLSLVHEAYHHYYLDIGRETLEFIIEQEAEAFYEENKNVVDSYARYRLTCASHC